MKTLTDEIVSKDTLTEAEIRLLCRRANAGEKMDKLNENGEGYNLTAEQVEKGKKWLINQWKTPRGIERKNNPFGYREESALNNIQEIYFTGLYDAGNYQYHFYVPIYEVIGIGEDGEKYGFQYVVSGGAIHIIG